MPRKHTDPASAWLDKAIEHVVRSGLSLIEAAAREGVHLSREEADGIESRRDFKRALRAARLSFYHEVAGDPQRDKIAAIGKLWILAEELHEHGAAEKAANVIGQLAKLTGWISAEPQGPSWMPTAKDLEEIRRRIEAAGLAAQSPESGAAASSTAASNSFFAS